MCLILDLLAPLSADSRRVLYLGPLIGETYPVARRFNHPPPDSSVGFASTSRVCIKLNDARAGRRKKKKE
ncbi:hypothetical protein NPIL_545781 [Nephila pilipes]|uniref:Uncharacterized protein n=1 Tax=Nephila pilipes TaxID=299642 RepID=A0A8X6KAN2_NEPPI|nr:hypothetical protein NPIL_545781 [Nephila pilipes]